MMAKVSAAADVPTTNETGRAAMAIPPTANIEAIRISTTDDAASQMLGREGHSRRRSRLV